MKYFEFVSVNTFPQVPEMNYGWYSISEFDSGIELFGGRIDHSTAILKLEHLKEKLANNPDATIEHESGEGFTTDVVCGWWKS